MMYKRLLAVCLTALLVLSLLPAAAFAAGDIVVSLGSVRAGSSLDLQIATTDSGTASLSGGNLPDQCTIETEESGEGFAHFLRGTPMTAGSYEFTIAVTDTITVVPEEPEPGDGSGEDGETGEEAGESGESGESGEGAVSNEETRTETVTIATQTFSIKVLPAVPTVTVHDVETFVAEEAKIELETSVADGGTLSYEWYWNDKAENRDGKLLEDETERKLELNTEFIGTDYYYCIVTNTNNGLTESIVTPVITVRIIEPVITSVSITAMPEKLEYTEGDTLDTKGLTLSIEYSNGVTVTDDEGFTCSPTELKTPGRQTITVTYREKTVSFEVEVKEDKEVVEAIAVSTVPLRREYRIGETLNTEGLVLQVITNKGNRSTVSSGFSCSPLILSTAGVQTITVSYGEKTTSFTVTVLADAKTVQKIEVYIKPTRMDYQVGDSFDSRGMVLLVTTDQGTEYIRDGFLCSPSRFTHDGLQTMVISYGGQSCTMELTVSPAPGQEEETSAPTQAPASDAPAETGAPENPKPTEKPSSPSRDEGRSKSAAGTLRAVIIIAALTGLCALLAYLYVSHQDQIHAFLNRLTGRSPDPDEDDDDWDDEDDE